MELEVLLAHRPEYALPLRHAPPSRAWLAACRRCCGPEIFFAFFDDLSEATTPDSAALASLLRKFQSQGSQRLTHGGRDLVIVDGPMPELPSAPAFIYLDRRRYADDEEAKIPQRIATHVIGEHCRVAVSTWRSGDTNPVLESVWLPQATSIGARTFKLCTNLEHISLPIVESIGEQAFYRCSSLRSVSLSARDFGIHVFSGCSQLRTVSLPNARLVSDHLFHNCTNLETVSMPVAARVCSYSLGFCSSLVTISLPSVRRVAARAFACCDKLEAVSLPMLDSVERSAFRHCPRLSKERILAPEHVKNTLPDSFEEDDEEEEVSSGAEEDDDDDYHDEQTSG